MATTRIPLTPCLQFFFNFEAFMCLKVLSIYNATHQLAQIPALSVK